jgi:TPR repeat protein
VVGKLINAAIVAVISIISLAVPVIAGPYEDAQSAYQSGDYAAALQLLHRLAEHGDARAQDKLGIMYRDGQGTRLDYSEAVLWFRRAADKGVPDDQNNLGDMYYYGHGVTQDYAEAAELYRKAAEQGFARAQNNLGHMYDDGHGVAQDYTEAVRWYRKAAERGSRHRAPDRRNDSAPCCRQRLPRPQRAGRL